MRFLRKVRGFSSSLILDVLEHHIVFLFFCFTLVDVMVDTIFTTLSPVLNHISLQLACYRSFAFDIDSAAFLLGTVSSQLVIVELLHLLQHDPRIFHLLTVPRHLVNRDLPLCLVASLVSIECRSWRQGLIAKQE